MTKKKSPQATADQKELTVSAKGNTAKDTTQTSATKETAPSEAPANSSTASASSATPKKPLPKKSFSIVLSIVWLLLVALLAAGAWFGWEFWQKQESRLQKLEAQLKEQSTWFAKSTSQQSALLETQEQRLDAFSQTLKQEQSLIQQRLDTHAQRLQTLSGSSRDNWVLEEVRYLLRLANQRQLTGGGNSGIIGLLTSADELLHELDLPDVFPIRDRIRKDILALQVAPQVDREGLYLQLSALAEQLDGLPPVPVTPITEKPIAEKPATPAPKSASQDASAGTPWQEGFLAYLKHAFGHLDRYIRVDHYDKPVKPILSERQQRLMAQNLRLMMEQAQTAVMREEQGIYRESLKKVIQWLELHYAHYAQQPALVEQLYVLQQQNIVSVLPSISSSLLRLNDYMQQRNTLSPETKPTQTLSPPASAKQEATL